MSDTGPADARRRFSMRTARMEAFSDGIFAFAATLLVLDLVVPAATSKHVGHQLREQWPTYLAYLVSFVTIGNAWLSHSVITEYLTRKLDPSLVSYVVAIGIGLWRPRIAVTLYLVIALFMIIPFRAILREARRRRRS